jgi:hypothetical protein
MEEIRGPSTDTVSTVAVPLSNDDDRIQATDSETASGSGSARPATLVHPWPHLSEFYVLKSRDGNLLHFSCVLCAPREVIIKYHQSSLANLKSHVSRHHSAVAKSFEDRIKAGSSLGKHKQSTESSQLSQSSGSSTTNNSTLEPSTKRIRQATVAETFNKAASGVSVRQTLVDEKIVDLFVYNMLPLRVVESPTFVSLITTLNPHKSSMSRRTLGRQIVTRHRQLEEYIIRFLQYSLLNMLLYNSQLVIIRFQ